jgi:hypothetical protein
LFLERGILLECFVGVEKESDFKGDGDSCSSSSSEEEDDDAEDGCSRYCANALSGVFGADRDLVEALVGRDGV